MERLSHRTVKGDDVSRVIEFSKEFDFYDGDDTMRLYFEHSDPAGWEIIVDENNNLVAYQISNFIGDVTFGYEIGIKKEYRGRRLGLMFRFRPGHKDEATPSGERAGGFCGWATQSSLVAFVPNNKQPAISEKITEYSVELTKTTLESLVCTYFVHRHGTMTYVSRNEEDSHRINEYAKRITPLDRREFWQAYGYDRNAVTVIAEKKGEIIGFGMLRQEVPRNSHILQPLYADSPAIARSITAELLHNQSLRVAESTTLHFPMVARHRWMHELAQQLNMDVVFSLIGWYQPRARQIFQETDFSRIYVTHYFWPA